jgi:hypothetical protein
MADGYWVNRVYHDGRPQESGGWCFLHHKPQELCACPQWHRGYPTERTSGHQAASVQICPYYAELALAIKPIAW